MPTPLVRCPQCLAPCKRHCTSPTCAWFTCVVCSVYGDPIADRWAFMPGARRA